MNWKRSLFIGIALGLAAALLVLGWLALPHPKRAIAAAQPHSNSNRIIQADTDDPISTQSAPAGERTPPGPDPRWLALVQAELEAKSGARQIALSEQTAAAELSLHLDLTRGTALGQALSGEEVQLEVWRGSQRMGTGSSTPYLEGDRFTYLIGYIDWVIPDCYYEGTCSKPGLNPADVVRVTQAGAAISLTIPALSALADPFTDRVYGQAVPNLPLTAYLFPAALESNTYITRSVTVSPGGVYQVDFQSTGGLTGNDDGFIQQRLDGQRSLYRQFVAPYLRWLFETGVISGRTVPYSTITFSLSIPDSETYTFFSWSDSTGSFTSFDFASNYGGFSYPPGTVVSLQTAGQIISVSIAELNASADLEQQTVTGRGLAGASIRIERYPGPKFPYDTSLYDNAAAGIFTTSVAANGAYTASLPLARPNYGYACQVTPENSQLCAQFVAPYFEYRLGESHLYNGYLLSAQLPAYNQPVTIAIAGPSGYLKTFLNRTINSQGLFQIWSDKYDPYNPFPWSGDGGKIILTGGDVVTITPQHQAPFVLVLPELTAVADSASDQVYGQAPPGAQLELIFWASDYYDYPAGISYSQTILVGSDGSYLVDLKNAYDIQDDSLGDLRYITPEGHVAQRSFPAIQACQFRLESVTIGSNLIRLAGPVCAPASVSLEDAVGQIKSEIPIYPNDVYYSIHFMDDDWQPVPIAPGDRVILNDGSTQTSYNIPVFDLVPDPQSDQVRGQAPPATSVYVNIKPYLASEYDYYNQTLEISVTASLTGAYSLNFSGLFDLIPGDFFQGYLQQNGVQYWRAAPIPYLQIELGRESSVGDLPPLSPYLLTIERAGLVLTSTGQAGEYGSINPWLYQPEIGHLLYQPGDRVRLETPELALSSTLPRLSAQIDLVQAVVAGTAPAGAELRVALGDRPLSWSDGTVWGKAIQAITATADGSFEAAFPNLAPMREAFGAVLYVSPEGIHTAMSFSSPRFDITLADTYLSGYTWTPGLPYTLTVSPQVGPAVIVTRTAEYNDGSFYVSLPAPLQAGDQLALHMPGYPEFAFTVPMLSAVHDYARQTLTGEAPPNRLVEVEFRLGSYYYRRTYSSAAGRYGIDTSDLPLTRGVSGRVTIYEPGLAILQHSFVVQGYQVFLPVVGH